MFCGLEDTGPWFPPPVPRKPHMVAQDSYQNTWEAEAQGSEVQGHPLLQSKSDAIPGYSRPCVKN